MGASEPSSRRASTKQWSQVFLQDREVADIPFLQAYETNGIKRALVEAFLQEDSDPVPSRQIERARAFFAADQTVAVANLPPSRAWLYRHRRCNGISSEVAGHKTASQMAEALEQQGLQVSMRADINHLLVDIKHLTSDYGLALIRTVSCNNVATLRAALLGHLARITALRVVNSTQKFETFRMELHLPYLTLREVGSASTSFGCSETHRNTRPWADMTFLDRYTRELGLKGRSIFAAHATIVVSGWNSSKFTALSFIEPGPDVRSAEEQDDSADEDEDLDCNESPEPELLPEDTEDQFATYGWQTFHRLHDRRWDPRVCFLRAVQIKIKVALQEYDYLIEHLCHVVDWIETDLFPATNISHTRRDGKRLCQVELFEFVHRITNLLIKLREVLAETNRAWSKFNGEHGDIAYFSDLSDRFADDAFNAMRGDFEDLLGLERKTKSMEEVCKTLSKTLDTTLGQESNRMTREALESNFVAVKLNKRTTDIAAVTLRAAADTSRITHMSVYLVIATSPFIIALQYFTSEQPLFSFERSPRTFFISVTVLIPLLFICALGLYGFDRYKWTLVWKIYAILGGKKRQPRKHLSEIAEEIMGLDHAQDSPAAVV